MPDLKSRGSSVIITCYIVTASLDVQGSILVTDAGLDSLLSLLKLKYLDVNRTDVSADSLAEFVRRTPSIVSLGSWEEFSDFEEGIFTTLTEISTNSFSLKTNVKISACVSLTKLHLRMTNSSEKIHTVGSLRSIFIYFLSQIYNCQLRYSFTARVNLMTSV